MGLVISAPQSDARHANAVGNEAYYYGHIGPQRFKIPRSLVLSTVSSDPDSAWKTGPPEPNDYERPIRHFDLRLENLFNDVHPTPTYAATLNTRGFIEADAYVVPAEYARDDALALLTPDLSGKGLSGRFVERKRISGMRHWTAVIPPNGVVASTDLFLDKEQNIALRCIGGAMLQTRGRGLCTLSFSIPRYKLLITASFSGADLVSTGIVKRKIENYITSFAI